MLSLSWKQTWISKKVWENKDFYNVGMPSKSTKILEINQYQKSDKTPFLIYADLECLIEKIDGCKNSPKSSFTINVCEHTMYTISSFKIIVNKNDR